MTLSWVTEFRDFQGKEHRLPSILDPEEVVQLLKYIRTIQNFMCLSTIYACGLRISEALNGHTMT